MGLIDSTRDSVLLLRCEIPAPEGTACSLDIFPIKSGTFPSHRQQSGSEAHLESKVQYQTQRSFYLHYLSDRNQSPIFQMRPSTLVLLIDTAILAFGAPSPAASPATYTCRPAVAVNSANTPTATGLGIVNAPPVSVGGTDTGTNESLICCKPQDGGVGAAGTPSSTCLDGKSREG